MSYTKTIWLEHQMSEAQKITALNNAECQYDDSIVAALAHTHDNDYYTKAEADARFYGSAHQGAGSGMNCGTLDGYSANDIISASVPAGLIFMYAGAGWSPPGGFEFYTSMHQNFPIGAGSTYALGATGGSSYTGSPTGAGGIAGRVLSDYELPAHTHTFSRYHNWPNPAYRLDEDPKVSSWAVVVTGVVTNTDYGKDASEQYAGGGSHNHDCTVSISSINHTPPHMILQFIKKT